VGYTRKIDGNIIKKETKVSVTKRSKEIVGLVRTRNQAQAVLAELLQKWGSETAYERLRNDAVYAKQTTKEEAWRTAGNLLNSFVVRKPEGYVEV
jgi:hypothetical protein